MDSFVQSSRNNNSRRRGRIWSAVAAGLLGLAFVAAGSGTGSAAPLSSGLASARPAASGVPRISAPKVTHEPDAYELLGVSCSSASHCLAVGYGDGSSVQGGVAIPITDGKPGKPLIAADSSSVFRAVRCVSATECVIAGEGTPADSSSAQAEVWLARSGKLSLLRQTGSAVNLSSNFRAVACWSARACEAVGDADYVSKKAGAQPTTVLGHVTLTGRQSVAVADDGTLGYAAGVSCPSTRLCYVGGATVTEDGALADLSISHQALKDPVTQSDVAGVQALACPRISSCGAAEVEYLSSSQTAGWVEHLNSRMHGTPRSVPGAALMFGIAAVNSAYFLGVGSSTSDGWLTDLMTSAGRARAPGLPSYDGYLQAVTCPEQTECIAVGFAPDSATKQPGGLDGVDGAIAIFHLTTAPSAPRISVRSRSGSTVTLKIVPPRSTGGAKVTSYGIAVSRCKPHHAGCDLESVKTVHAAGSKRTVKITGLSSGTTYYFQARAVNSIGAGPYSGRVRSAG